MATVCTVLKRSVYKTSKQAHLLKSISHEADSDDNKLATNSGRSVYMMAIEHGQ